MATTPEVTIGTERDEAMGAPRLILPVRQNRDCCPHQRWLLDEAHANQKVSHGRCVSCGCQVVFRLHLGRFYICETKGHEVRHLVSTLVGGHWRHECSECRASLGGKE